MCRLPSIFIAPKLIDADSAWPSRGTNFTTPFVVMRTPIFIRTLTTRSRVTIRPTSVEPTAPTKTITMRLVSVSRPSICWGVRPKRSLIRGSSFSRMAMSVPTSRPGSGTIAAPAERVARRVTRRRQSSRARSRSTSACAASARGAATGRSAEVGRSRSRCTTSQNARATRGCCVIGQCARRRSGEARGRWNGTWRDQGENKGGSDSDAMYRGRRPHAIRDQLVMCVFASGGFFAK